jgi:hypothetical protein
MAPFAKKATTDEQRLRGMPTFVPGQRRSKRADAKPKRRPAMRSSFRFQFFQARIGRCFRIDESRLHVEVEMALPPLDRHADETKREHRSAFRGGRFSEAPALFEVCQYAMSV